MPNRSELESGRNPDKSKLSRRRLLGLGAAAGVSAILSHTDIAHAGGGLPPPDLNPPLRKLSQEEIDRINVYVTHHNIISPDIIHQFMNQSFYNTYGGLTVSPADVNQMEFGRAFETPDDKVPYTISSDIKLSKYPDAIDMQSASFYLPGNPNGEYRQTDLSVWAHLPDQNRISLSDINELITQNQRGRYEIPIASMKNALYLIYKLPSNTHRAQYLISTYPDGTNETYGEVWQGIADDGRQIQAVGYTHGILELSVFPNPPFDPVQEIKRILSSL